MWVNSRKKSSWNSCLVQSHKERKGKERNTKVGKIYPDNIMFSYPQPEPIHCAFPVIQETLPRSKLGYHSNTTYPEFPPKMADGRSLIASYQPEAVLNANLIKQQGIQSNWQYRQYLTANSQQIAQQNFREACNDVGYFERFLPGEMGNQDKITATPYLYDSYLSSATPVGYSSSDLKSIYLSREQLNARLYSPSLTQAELFSQRQQP